MNKILSTTMAMKIIAAALAGVMFVTGVFPVSNVRVRSLLVCLDIIEHDPMILNAVSLSYLNDAVILTFFYDSSKSNTGALAGTGQKRNPFNTHLDSCVNNLKQLCFVKSVQLTYTGGRDNGSSLKFADVVSACAPPASLMAGQAALERTGCYLGKQLTMVSLPRGDTLVGYALNIERNVI